MNETQANALIISLAAKYLLAMLPEEAVSKLEATIQAAHETVEQNDVLKTWHEKVVILEHWEGVLEEVTRQGSEQLLDSLKNALYQNNQVTFSYKKKNRVNFNLFGLVVRNNQLYIVGSYQQNSSPYLLSLRDISDIEITEVTAIQPESDFSLKQYAEDKLNFYEEGNNIEKLIVEFPMDVFSYVQNNHPKADNVKLEVQNQSHNSFQLIASNINNNTKLHQWLLGFHNNVYVIEPLSLRQIINHADIDNLTKLNNRNTYLRWINREIDVCHRDESHKFSLLMMDVDYFKKINDTYGHSVGDEVLKEVANCLREHEGIRYGGEEFIVFLPGNDANSALKVAERIRSKLEKTIINDAIPNLKITISIGVAEFPLHLSAEAKLKLQDKHLDIKTRDLLVSDIYEKFDKALYQAKENGRNQCVIATSS